MKDADRHLRSSALVVGALVVAVGACGEPDPPAGALPYLELTQSVGTVAPTTGNEPAAVKADRERQTLWIGDGAEVSYLFKLRPGSVFATKDIALRGEALRLEVELEADGLGVAHLVSLDESRPELSLPLELQNEPPVRLTLRARSSVAGAGGGALIREPVIRVSSPASSVAPVSARGRSDRVAGDASERRPNVLIYLIDTLRSDRLGCYGYERNVSPRIDEFAATATLFERVISQSSWTKASVASMFTGVWPPAHGATGWKHVLPSEFRTLAEELSRAGYQTVGFSGNPNVVEAYGMNQGFDEFHRRLKRTSEDFNRMAFDWLERRDRQRPFLLYLHTMDPHAPYEPPEPFRSRLAPDADRMPSWQPSWKWPLEALPYLSDLYDAEIAFNDASFGALIDRLRELGLYEDTLIVVVSDHGEEFKEHGRWRHGATLYAESLEVPLIMRLPRQTQAHRVSVPVQHIDLMPTLLDALELEVPAGVQGRSLMELVENPESADMAPHIFSHLKLGKSPLIYSMMDGEWKLIHSTGEDWERVELYNWRADPGETEDLASEYPVRTAWMRQAIERQVAAFERRNLEESTTVDPEIEEALEALGYLE